jgi:hypothetical protein
LDTFRPVTDPPSGACEAAAAGRNRPSNRWTRKARQAGVKFYTDLAQITAIHPQATFSPEGTDVTMRELLRRTIEKTGLCIGVSVDANGRYHSR